MHYARKILSRHPASLAPIIAGLMGVFLIFACLSGCKKQVASEGRPPAPVTVLTITPSDTPFVPEFVGQTQSAHQVEIRARVSGFLEKRVYTEGSLVKAGQVLFTMDPKPFQAQLEAAQGALSEQQARLVTARANLARVKPLAEQDALSQKDLDDAVGQDQAAAAAVSSARAQVETAKLNLSYTTIAAPVTGLSSYARVQEGAYISQANNLLTIVSSMDPLWVNFSLSENDILKLRNEEKAGLVRLPKDDEYLVEIVLADGSIFPKKGRITFADAEFSQQTGTFLLRSTISNPHNPQTDLRPGQFVRVRVLGIVVPKAVVVPQRAVQQGAKGHFLWVVNKENKAEPRPVVVGDWVGDSIFISEGVRSGDRIVVDGGLTLTPGEPVAARAYVPPAGSAAAKGGEAAKSASSGGKKKGRD